MHVDLEELDSLLFDWESGSLDEDGIKRIREMLRKDADARSHFVTTQMISAAMQADANAALDLPFHGDSHSEPDFNSKSTTPNRRVRAPYFWISIAASLLACMTGSWLVYSHITGGFPRPSPIVGNNGRGLRDASKEPTAQGVALVTRLVGVTWGSGQAGIEVGQALLPGRFAIQAGHAQIEFFCGATVVVEGPAELHLESATRARVKQGRLRAHVPPAARGFSLKVDDLRVVDLGTEFGLSVSASGTNVQVFDGEVELHPPASERRLVKSGEAIVRTAQGEYQAARAVSASFVGIADLESLAQLQESARYRQWETWSAGLRHDPRLIAYYSFDEPGDWKRRLACSNEPANRELDGAIVGAQEVAGRWSGKRALEFKQPADRVRVQIPGEYGSLSLICWVKIDSLDRWYNSLFLTDGYEKGEPHWQILDDGRLYFSVRPVERGESGPRDYKALSPPFWEPSMHGKWIHLAVTCDVETNAIVHYLNGQILSRHTVPESRMPTTTRIGTASIGNWALPTLSETEFAIRNLNGSMGEFALFAAALTAEEIQEIYQYGKP